MLQKEESEMAAAIGAAVRGTIFPDCKFANEGKLFEYLPVRDPKDPTRGVLFRAVKKTCGRIGANEELWWRSVKKTVKVALSRKRSSVISSVRAVILGK